MTRNRQAQAAARSTPHGTWARREVRGPAGDRPGSAPSPSARADVCPLVGDPLGEPFVVAAARRRRTSDRGRGRRRAVGSPGARCSRGQATCPRSASRATSRYGRLGVSVGEQAGGGQHVVGVDDDPRRPGSCQPPSTVADAAGEDPAGDPGSAVAQHAAGADQQVDLAQVLAGALDDPAVGADHDLAAAGVPAQREPDRGARRSPRRRRARRRSVGHEAGVVVAALRRPRQVVEPGRLDGGDAPTSACRGRPRRCGSPAWWRPPRGRAPASSGSSSTTECTSVVAPPTSTTTTSPAPGARRRDRGEQLDAGQHDVGRGAARPSP